MWLEYNKSNRLRSLIRLAKNMSFITLGKAQNIHVSNLVTFLKLHIFY